MRILSWRRNTLNSENLMNEYRDGILLFDISNREVWEKASNDVAGLQNILKLIKNNILGINLAIKGI